MSERWSPQCNPNCKYFSARDMRTENGKAWYVLVCGAGREEDMLGGCYEEDLKKLENEMGCLYPNLISTVFVDVGE